ncbi:MAG: EamA family transporter RarD [Alysiella sp.]|uniref:EamA family transporter n=1 Tax=Alysiella sp. TaxID=1872483 RepID=UPI0026DAADCC|nr:EamA family transporter RarD [Alysiella sp.]MDO4433865.1 EamA family transporter RarD [Alysiella sp.]
MQGNLQKGIFAAILSNILFAILYLYSGWLKPLSGTEVFAWRMVMMLPSLWACVWLLGGLGELRKFVLSLGENWYKWLILLLPTPILGFQLWLFMYAPINGMGVDVAMGYFLFPLMLALGGRIFFKARLNTWQKLALVVATVAVAHELWQTQAFAWGMWAVCLGYPPYYLLRRYAQVPALIGLLIDLSVIAPLALAYLLFSGGLIQAIDFSLKYYFLIPMLGVISAVALGLNLQANKDLPVPLFSMLSYLEPILLFMSAWLILGNEVSVKSVPTYVLIGVALALSLIDGWLKMRQERGKKMVYLSVN